MDVSLGPRATRSLKHALKLYDDTRSLCPGQNEPSNSSIPLQVDCSMILLTNRVNLDQRTDHLLEMVNALIWEKESQRSQRDLCSNL